MASPTPTDQDVLGTVSDKVTFGRRLSSQMLFVQLALVAVVVAFVVVYFPSRQQQQARGDLRDTGRGLMIFMAQAITPALDMAYDDFTREVSRELVQEHIILKTFETARNNRDLIYAELRDLKGQTLLRQAFDAYAQRPDEVGALFAALPAGADEARVSGDFVLHQQRILRPDGQTQTGVLRVAFSLERVTSEARLGVLTTLLVGLGIMLVSFLAITVMGQRLIGRPMASLVNGARQIAEGRLTTRLQTGVSNEIGVLGLAFVRMQVALQRVISRVAQTASAVAATIGPVQHSAGQMLQGARQQSAASEATIQAVASVDGAALAIDRSLGELNASADQVSAGTYQLSQSLLTLRDEVLGFTRFVQDTDGSMRQVSGTAADIAELVTKMATATESAAASVAELERSIQVVEASATDNASLSESVSQRATVCQEAVSKTIAGMREIGTAFTAIDTAVAQLDESVANISKIVQVINDISDQTKLLSLNASILAAQAGEHGKGFSVVADQIKQLSDRTAASTGEISALLSSIGSGRQRTSQAMKHGMQSVEQGRELSEQAGREISAIRDLALQGHQQMIQMSTATREQARGSTLISQSTSQTAEMGRSILDAAERQRRGAEAVQTLTGSMVTKLGAVQRTIEEEAKSSSMVAEQVDRIRTRAGAISSESATQRRLTGDMVDQIQRIRTHADAIVRDAQGVVELIGGLVAKADQLTTEVARFEIE